MHVMSQNGFYFNEALSGKFQNMVHEDLVLLIRRIEHGVCQWYVYMNQSHFLCFSAS